MKVSFKLVAVLLLGCCLLSVVGVASASTSATQSVSLPWALINVGTAQDFTYFTSTGQPYHNYTLVWDLNTLKYSSGTPDVSCNFLTFAVTTAGNYFKVVWLANGSKTVTFGAVQAGAQVQADYSYTGKFQVLSADYNGQYMMVKIDGKEVFAPDIVYADALKGYQVIGGSTGTLTGASTLKVQFYNVNASDSAAMFGMLGAIVMAGIVFILIKKVK